MTLVVIKLGDEVYNGSEGDEEYELFRFLNVIMYPHKKGFMSTVSEYIDYSDNEELWKEVTELSTIEQIRYEGMMEDFVKLKKEMIEDTRKEIEEIIEKRTEEARKKVREEITEKVREEVTEKVREEGIQALILDNLEEQVPRERIIIKLQKRFHLTEEKSEQYYEKFVP